MNKITHTGDEIVHLSEKEHNSESDITEAEDLASFDQNVRQALNELSKSLYKLLDYDYSKSFQDQKDHNIILIIKALAKITERSIDLPSDLTSEYPHFFENLEDYILTHQDAHTRLRLYQELKKVVKKDAQGNLVDPLSKYARQVIEKAAGNEEQSEARLEAFDIFTRISADQTDDFAFFVAQNWPKDALNLLADEDYKDEFYRLYVRMIGEILKTGNEQDDCEWYNNILTDIFFIAGPEHGKNTAASMDSVKQDVLNVWKDLIHNCQKTREISPYIKSLENIINHPEMGADIKIEVASTLFTSFTLHPELEERVMGFFEDQINQREGMVHKFMTALRGGPCTEENEFGIKIKEYIDRIHNERLADVKYTLSHTIQGLEDYTP